MKIRILLVAIALSLSPCSRGENQDKTEKVADQKVYVVNLEQGRNGYVLNDVESSDFAGVKCLKGRYVDISWMKGKICYIPTESILSIVEYDSFEDYKEAIKQYTEDRMK